MRMKHNYNAIKIKLKTFELTKITENLQAQNFCIKKKKKS